MAWLIAAIVIVAVVAHLIRKRTRRLDLSILPEQFVVFDLETTGLDAVKHEIIEIGAIRVYRDRSVHDTFQTLVRPSRKVSKKITGITGITQEMLDRDGDALEQAMRDFAEFVRNDRLVAYNAEFDLGFIHAAAARCGFKMTNPCSCALKMARRAWPRRRSYRLVDMAKDGNLNVDGAHRALHDCHLTMTVYAAAASRLRSHA